MESITDQILTILKQSQNPLNKSELARELDLHPKDRAKMRNALAKLESQGMLVMGKKSRYSLRGSSSPQLVGTISFLRSGGALFFPDVNDEQNINSGVDLDEFKKIFISSKNSLTALDGDRVVVEITYTPAKRRELEKKGKGGNKGRKYIPEKRSKGGYKGNKTNGGKTKADKTRGDELPAGKVVLLVKRRTTNVVGVYFKRGKFSYIQPDDTLLPPSMEVGECIGAKTGQKVTAKLISWENPWDTPRGEVIEVLGWPEDPGVDIVSVIRRYNLPESFNDTLMAHAKAAHETGVPESEIQRREDWRDRIVITIDPWDAKDHDDAITVKKLDNGWELAVHIADVSHYVTEHSELDKEALQRGNSTYLVDRVLPMLPELLSNDMCSLRPNVDRLTKCAVMNISSSGEVKDFYLCDAVIHSQYKLSYEEAQKILDDPKAEGELADLVKESWKMASVLRKRRFTNGSLDLEFPEIKVVLNEQKTPIRIDKVVHLESHQLVEECMLIANETVAIALKRKNKKAIHRIHENPDFDKLEEFAETARAHGFETGDLTNKQHVQKLIKSIKGDPSEQAIKIGLLKSLKRAVYSTDALGHYGLGKMDYCHFTSPIRRYADLIVHRALQSILKNPPENPSRVMKLASLMQAAEHISTTERNSAAAEGETKKMKLMEYLIILTKSEEEVEFDAIVTDVRPIGVFVELLELSEKALVKKKDFTRGDWFMDTARGYYANSKGERLGLGQKLKVAIKEVNMEKKLIDVKIVSIDK